MDKVLEKQWHAVCQGKELGSEKPVGATILGLDVVVWRCGDHVIAWEDL